MNLFTADVGQGKVHIYDSNRDIAHLKLPQERLINLDIDGLKSGDILVIEDFILYKDQQDKSLTKDYKNKFELD